MLLFGGVSRVAAAATASELLKLAGVSGGLVVHVGCGDGQLTGQLRVGPQYYVHGIDTSAEKVRAARQRLLKQGVYGPVCVDTWDGRHLPYADDLVNLLIVEDQAQASDDELLRVLTPNGVLLKKTDDGWQKTVKPWPAEMDQWTHYFHGPDGNPVSNDQLIAPPKRLRWIGTPRWARHHDHMASLTSMVSANGRLFYILDEGSRASIQLPPKWRLVARDAFNGVVLWKRDISRWNTTQYPLKSGPAHLLRRLVAVGDRVYVTLDIDGPVEVLDAATGKTLRTLDGSRFTREIVVSNGTVLAVADNGPSRLPKWRRVSTYVWANTRTANPNWGWHGDKRKILAYDAESGRLLWTVETPVAPCSLATNGQRIVFHDGEKLVCLDQATGKQLWASQPVPLSLPVHTNTGPRILIYEDVVLYAEGDKSIIGWSLADGKKLWQQKKLPSGHMSLRDLFVVQGLAWTGRVAGSSDDGLMIGYDPKTGEKKREFLPDVKVHWFHHRCYPAKAANHYILTGRNGTEYVDLETGHWKPHHWFRSGCIYGVMPANGLTYATFDACGCQLEAKLPGLKAMSASPVPRPEELGELPPRLEKGPAYGKVDGPEASASDWPTYRHDEARSGSSSEQVDTELVRAWQTELGGRLSPPTIAAGKVFVAAIDRHTVYALDAKTGQVLWSYTTGGRVDSPPTYYRGYLLFGSADGYVYALRAKDGVLAWRFRAAPVDQRIMAWEQLESAWPVHGAVLVHDGVVYCTAGRIMYLDGGIHFLKLDATTGKLLREVVMDDKDPVTGQDMHLAYLKKTSGNVMPVALNDVLSCDGRFIWLRSQKIDFDGNRLELELKNVTEQGPPEDFHLFCQAGLLDDSWFFRTYWTYGRRMSGGYGGWLKAGRLVPSGRILCFDDTHVYGFGRKPVFYVNSSVIQYQIFASDKAVTAEAIERVTRAQSLINRRSPERNADSSDWLVRYFFPRDQLTAARYTWVDEQPAVLARAMALSADAVLLAGPPNFIDERQAYRMPDDPEVQKKLKLQDEALQGLHGAELWVMAKKDGKLLARYALDSAPVFDGLAVADGKVFVSTLDGRVLCLSGPSGSPLKGVPLKKVTDAPTHVKWDKPEDPNYLLPLEKLKNSDFQRVQRCDVVESKLGYKLVARGRRQLAFAVKRLPKPLTQSVTLKTRLRVPSDTRGLLQNGYVVFGSAPDDKSLVKCGVRVRMKKAMVIQGPSKKGQTKSVNLNVPAGQVLDVVVQADLKAKRLTFQVGPASIETTLSVPLERVRFVGFAVDDAMCEFAPLEVSGQ